MKAQLAALIVIAAFGLVGEARAQTPTPTPTSTPTPGPENWAFPASASRVAKVQVLLTAHNILRVCAPNSIAPANCTQANVCTAMNIAPCTPAAARTANARIYPSTTAGREEFFIFKIVADSIPDIDQHADTARRSLYDRWLATATQAEKDAECSKSGAPAGCAN